MSRRPAGSALPGLAAATLLWTGAAAVLSTRPDSLSAAPRAASSLASHLLGSSRHVLGAAAYARADLFFHMGVAPYQDTAFSNSVAQRLEAAISPRDHRHASGGGVREIMPWLRLATRADPTAVEPYLTAAFWMTSEGGRPDLAREILLEAQRHNPGSYEVAMERGRLCLKTNDLEGAAVHLDRGLRLWPGGADPKDRHTLLDLREMLLYRGLLFETDGSIERALAAFRIAAGIYPETTQIGSRIADLEAGRSPSIAARDLWRLMWNAKYTPACMADHPGGHEEAHGDGDGHDHHHDEGPRDPPVSGSSHGSG